MIRVLRSRRLEHSFAFSTALLVLCVIGTALFVAHTRVKSILKSEMAARGYSVAQSIGAVVTPSLLAYNYPALQAAAENAVDDPDLIYVVIHDKEGALAGMAGHGVRSVETFPGLPDNVASPLTRDLVFGSYHGTDTPVFEAVVPVHVEGVQEPWGTVRVGLGYQPMIAELRRLDLGLLGLAAILAVVAVSVGRWMARRIAAPLRELAAGTEALSAGDTSYRIPVPETGAVELTELARAFNLMIDRLHDKAAESTAYQDQLGRLNSTLEEQVRERTRALEESETQYRTLVEHSPDSILIVQQGRVLFSNRAFEETFGITQSRARETSFRLEKRFQEECRSSVTEHLRAWEDGEPMPPVMVGARDPQGRQRELEMRGSRIEYRGEPAAECLLIDVTETKRLREQLEDSERLRSLGELSSGVAHDFNNLLGAILGRAQLLRGRDFPSDVDRELAVIEKAACDGRETVRRIQEFSRVRNDRPSATLELTEIIRDAVEITRTRWKSEAERRNVKIVINVDCDEVSPIRGNATELREVFTNLILNAVDAMPQGGSLTLRCSEEDGRVRAEVEDDGVGMTEEIRRHLFDPFYSTKGEAGTGLGMSVAYGIVKRHGGTIDVASRLGVGAKFTVEFPASLERPVIEAGDGAPMPELFEPGRILVIDDEQSIAQLIDDALTGVGHSVEIALSAAEGLKMAELSEFDLVLTDLGMPDMSGWELAGRLRDRAPELPVVLVTGWGTTIRDDEVRDSGIAAVLSKPFEIRDLLETTGRVLQSAAATEEEEAEASPL